MSQRKNTTPEQLHASVTSRKELLRQGIKEKTIRHLINSGELHKIRTGVYCSATLWHEAYPSVRAVGEISAWFQRSPHSVFSHQSAALLHGLPLLTLPEKVHIYSPSSARGSAHGVVKHPRTAAEYELHQWGMRLTSPEQTIVDCARALPLRESLPLADAYLRRRPEAYPELKEALNTARGWGATSAQEVAATMSCSADSIGETQLRLILLSEKLPPFSEQYEIIVAGRRFFADFAFPELKIVVEFDGRIKYTEYAPTQEVLIAEREREKMLTNAGWRVLRFDWNMVVKRAEYVRAVIAQAVEAVEDA